MSWIGKALVQMQSLGSGFVPQSLYFEGCGKSVVTTSLIAEGGYSFIYCAREAGLRTESKLYALKKVLAQDEETRAIAEMECKMLTQLKGKTGFVQCHDTMCRRMPNGNREYWMLLEHCPNGSLIDVIYKKNKTGEYEPNSPLPQPRVLELLAMVADGVAHLHSLKPPVQHRDLKLENVLGTADGRYVLCDFGSATTSILAANRSRAELVAEEERITKYSTMMYRAPEMCDLYSNQEIGPPCDVWALGCIAYTLCFRKHPFLADSPLQVQLSLLGVEVRSCVEVSITLWSQLLSLGRSVPQSHK